MAAPVRAETRGLIGGKGIFRAVMDHTAPEPTGFSRARAFDTDWMCQNRAHGRQLQMLHVCVIPMRFAPELRGLMSLGDPSDMCKRTGEENCGMLRNALTTSPVLRAAVVVRTFFGPVSWLFPSGLSHGYLGLRQRANCYLGQLFQRAEFHGPRQWRDITGRRKCQFYLVLPSGPPLGVIRT